VLKPRFGAVASSVCSYALNGRPNGGLTATSTVFAKQRLARTSNRAVKSSVRRQNVGAKQSLSGAGEAPFQINVGILAWRHLDPLLPPPSPDLLRFKIKILKRQIISKIANRYSITFSIASSYFGCCENTSRAGQDWMLPREFRR